MPAPLSLAALIIRNRKPARRPAIVAGYVKPNTANPSKIVENSAELREAGAAAVHTGTLDACLAALQAGDTLAATTPDHLARSPRALLTLEAKLSSRGVSLLVLRLGAVRLDTREAGAGIICHHTCSACSVRRFCRNQALICPSQRGGPSSSSRSSFAMPAIRTTLVTLLTSPHP